MKRLVLILVLSVAATLAPAAVASPTVRMTIVHFFQGCHVWGTNTGTPLGPTKKLSVVRGTKLVIRVNCPMSFDFSQVSGPAYDLGDPRTYAGTTRTFVFRKVGVYVFKAVNVESSDDQGLETLGPDNTLQLTVRVHN